MGALLPADGEALPESRASDAPRHRPAPYPGAVEEWSVGWEVGVRPPEPLAVPIPTEQPLPEQRMEPCRGAATR
jgi:hypothetical protein